MGFGISGFVNSFTKKAIIRYVDPAIEEETGQSIEDIDYGMLDKLKILVGAMDSVVSEITPDVKKSEVHRYQSEVTENTMEDGTILAQHIIQRPVEVTLQFEKTNAGTLSKAIERAVSMFGMSGGDALFNELEKIWSEKIKVQVVTERKSYNNMVLKNMPIVHKSPYRGALQIMCDFIQVSKVSLQTVSYKGKTMALAKAVSPRIDGGKQLTKDAED